MKNKGLMIGASIGSCVHVAGVVHFLTLAEKEGYESVFLGPAVPVDEIIRSIGTLHPAYCALGYRLTPANAVPLVRELKQKFEAAYTGEKRPVMIFGGTKPVAEEVRKLDFFDVIFDGTEDLDDSIFFLRNGRLPGMDAAVLPAWDLVSRIREKQPYPLLRHHFGLPSYAETLAGVQKIAEARVLDVISLGIDQNTQQYFYHPELRKPENEGAGGVPVRTEAEFAALKEASRCGNYPLMRCYSGTADVLPFGEMLKRSIDNAWCAVPLCWYNELDGRGTRKLEDSIADAQALMRRQSELGIPVEMNEPHHWGLRDAPDEISAAMSYISACNAKKAGVRDYVSQYMFNVPASLWFSMDLAKVLAQIELVESLEDENFRTYREVRAGLPLFSADEYAAKGQLAATTMLQMAVNPRIIHVVGYSEATQAATPEIVIESCRIVRGVIRQTLEGSVNMQADPAVQARKEEILKEAEYLIRFIRREYAGASSDPLTDPAVIADCIRRGILDAPHILKNVEFRGNIATHMDRGRCVAYDRRTGRNLTEEERIDGLMRGNQEVPYAEQK